MLVPDDLELIRWCGERGIGVLSYAPLAYGMLTGAIDRDTVFGPTDHRSGHGDEELYTRSFAPGDALERSLAVVDGLRTIAGRLGCSPAQLALAWNHHQQGVTGAIVGSRDAAHVRHDAAAGDLDLDATTRGELAGLIRRA